MASTQNSPRHRAENIRRHRADENPDGRPAPDLVRAHRAVTPAAPATPVAIAR